MDGSPDLRARKRSLSPNNETQTGTLNKHNTVMKQDPDVRRKLNQTFFAGNSNNCLSLTKEGSEQREVRRRKSKIIVRRRLNSENKQLLITSAFSPRPNRSLDPTATPTCSSKKSMVQDTRDCRSDDLNKMLDLEEHGFRGSNK